ncbi:MAG: hypothetical protein KAT74_11000, partial [Candidatus Cloacimonetes bacterium]|nr:hypothetical protein [Candidatus Cloacimonadota bacterium]
MKITIIFIILLLLAYEIFSFEITKISEFSFSESYSGMFSMDIYNEYLVSCNERSVQILSFYEDSLSLVSEINLDRLIDNLIVVDSIIYAASSFRKFWRIDISDIYNPIITHTLNYSASCRFFYDNGKIFVHQYHAGLEVSIHIFDHLTFIEIDEIYFPGILRKVTDGLGYSYLGDNTAYLYDITDYNNMTIVGSGSVYNMCVPYNVALYQDSIFVLSGSNYVRFYDISEPFNWELVQEINASASVFELVENKLFLYYGYENLLYYDIQDLENPQLLDSLDYFYPVDNIKTMGDYLFGQTHWGDIQIIDTSMGNLQLTGHYNHFGTLKSCYFYNNYLYTGTFLGGLICWDLTTLSEPGYVYSIDDDRLFWSCTAYRDTISFLYENRYSFSPRQLFYEIHDDSQLT